MMAVDAYGTEAEKQRRREIAEGYLTWRADNETAGAFDCRVKLLELANTELNLNSTEGKRYMALLQREIVALHHENLATHATADAVRTSPLAVEGERTEAHTALEAAEGSTHSHTQNAARLRSTEPSGTFTYAGIDDVITSAELMGFRATLAERAAVLGEPTDGTPMKVILTDLANPGGPVMEINNSGTDAARHFYVGNDRDNVRGDGLCATGAVELISKTTYEMAFSAEATARVDETARVPTVDRSALSAPVPDEDKPVAQVDSRLPSSGPAVATTSTPADKAQIDLYDQALAIELNKIYTTTDLDGRDAIKQARQILRSRFEEGPHNSSSTPFKKIREAAEKFELQPTPTHSS